MYLCDVAGLIMGHSPPSSTYNADGLGMAFFQGVRDFNYRHPSPRIFCSAPSRIAQPGDILFSVRAPIGRINIANTKCAIGRGLAIIRCSNAVDAHYMEFLLQYMKPMWSAMDSSGTVFGNATKKDLEKLLIRWPSVRERQITSRILRTLDSKIQLNYKMNQILEQMAQAVFKSWFVDYEFPDENGQPYKSSGGEMVYDEELGKEMPSGWKFEKLGMYVNVIKGRSYIVRCINNPTPVLYR